MFHEEVKKLFRMKLDMISVVSLYFSRGNKCDESVKVTTLIFLLFEIFLTAFNLKTGFRSGLIIKLNLNFR